MRRETPPKATFVLAATISATPRWLERIFRHQLFLQLDRRCIGLCRRLPAAQFVQQDASAVVCAGQFLPVDTLGRRLGPKLLQQMHVATILTYLMLGWYDRADAELDEEVRQFPDLAAIPETMARAHAGFAKFRRDDPAPPAGPLARGPRDG